MKIAIIDTEPKWIAFVTEILNEYELVNKDADLYLVSSLMVDKIIPGKTIAFSSLPSTNEAIQMYRLGAIDYRIKDFRKDNLLSVIFNVKSD